MDRVSRLRAAWRRRRVNRDARRACCFGRCTTADERRRAAAGSQPVTAQTPPPLTLHIPVQRATEVEA